MPSTSPAPGEILSTPTIAETSAIGSRAAARLPVFKCRAEEGILDVEALSGEKLIETRKLIRKPGEEIATSRRYRSERHLLFSH